LSEPEFSEFWKFSELFKPSTTEVRMNSSKLVLLTATLMLAMAFTFSCSSGDDDENPNPINGGGSSSSGGQGSSFNENSQVYNQNGGQDDGPIYTGSGVIKVMTYYDRSFALNAGSVTNGFVRLDLPNSIPNEYLIDIEFPNCPTITMFQGMFILTDSDREYTEELRIFYKDEQIWEQIMYWYFSKVEKEACNFEEEQDGYKLKVFINIDAKAGWNKIYHHKNHLTNEYYYDTNNILTEEVRWVNMN
jgi:hypothetical protein